MSKDRPGLKVYAVSTLDQALAVLAAHGGRCRQHRRVDAALELRSRDDRIRGTDSRRLSAMPEERRLSITSSPHLAPDDVARHTFGSVRRGFDPSRGPGLSRVARRRAARARRAGEGAAAGAGRRRAPGGQPGPRRAPR